MSKAVFEKCPNCNQELHNALYRHLFGKLAGQANTFEYECKACGAVLEVEAVPVPEFYVTLKSRPTKDAPDVAYCAECEWKLGDDGECINGCVQPIATQVI